MSLISSSSATSYHVSADSDSKPHLMMDSQAQRDTCNCLKLRLRKVRSITFLFLFLFEIFATISRLLYFKNIIIKFYSLILKI